MRMSYNPHPESNTRTQGVRLTSSGTTTFVVWAPAAKVVSLELNGNIHPMTRDAAGYWEVTNRAATGDDYRYVVDGIPLPDPASRWQPSGPHGPSRVWLEPPLRDGFHGFELAPGTVIYELHVGTFTQAGTFSAVIDHLDHLVDLGIDAIELMPVAAWSTGKRHAHNWGFDGVCPFAPSPTYGSPADLRALLAACHARGLAVLLDVVHNHLGPDGNYLPRFGPYHTNEPRGARPSTSTAPTPTTCAATSSTPPCTGWTTTASTACASTPRPTFTMPAPCTT